MTFNEINGLCNTIEDKMTTFMINKTRKSNLALNEDREKEASAALSDIMNRSVIWNTSNNVLMIFVEERYMSIRDIDYFHLLLIINDILKDL